MKTVYFVRHGESEANVGEPIYMGEKTRLTERGREQARFIAKRCTELAADVLIASTAVRAQETAEEIKKQIGKEIEIVEIFTERKLPTELLGKAKTDLGTKELYSQWISSFSKDGLRVGDGDNFSLLKARIIEALKYLEERPEKTLLVVSHGFFLHMTIALVLLGEQLTSDEFRRIAKKVWMDNSGITRLDYMTSEFMTDTKRNDLIPYEGWVLRVWNDHAHLG